MFGLIIKNSKLDERTPPFTAEEYFRYLTKVKYQTLSYVESLSAYDSIPLDNLILQEYDSLRRNIIIQGKYSNKRTTIYESPEKLYFNGSFLSYYLKTTVLEEEKFLKVVDYNDDYLLLSEKRTNDYFNFYRFGNLSRKNVFWTLPKKSCIKAKVIVGEKNQIGSAYTSKQSKIHEITFLKFLGIGS